MPIAPHEGREIEMVMNGIKPLASIEKSKQPEMFEKALALSDMIDIVVVLHDKGHLTITRKENEKLHGVFSLLCSPKAAMVVRSQAEKSRLLGRLFGYSEEDIDEFIAADMQCACGQCKFE